MRIQDYLDDRPRFGVVDVRSRAEWDAGHIEDATHIPLGELEERLGELPRDVSVVMVCRTGGRSGRGVETLRSRSVDADHLDGGLTAWTALGLPLVSSNGSPGRVADPGHAHGHLEQEHHDHGHIHDEHCEHDHGVGGEEVQNRILGLLAAVQEHFGDHDPTEEEARAFFEELLAEEGLSPDEIDRMLS